MKLQDERVNMVFSLENNEADIRLETG